MTTAWYENDPAALDRLRALLRKCYPTLHATLGGGKVRINGTFAILGENDAADRYSISVELPDDYPHSVPSVWETGGRIERTLERHVSPSTGSLCVGVPVELWVRLGGDFSIKTFLEKALRPYLIGNSMVEEGKPWPFDESTHGSVGVLEFYQRYLGISEPDDVGDFLLAVLAGRVRGHWPCPCGSGKPIRRCHNENVRSIRAAPISMLRSSVDHMTAVIKARIEAAKATRDATADPLGPAGQKPIER